MIGVDILSSSEVVVNTMYPCRGFAIGVLFTIVVLGIFGGALLALKTKSDLFILFGMVIGLVIGAPIGYKIDMVNKEDIYQTRYKATISEEVNFVEFNEKYEIIDQEGKIYTIIERK